MSRSIASADSSDFATKPAAGVWRMSSAKSASAWVEMRITVGPSPPLPASSRATSKPLSRPRTMSTSTDVGAQLPRHAQRLGGVRRQADHRHALTLEKLPGRISE